ncbi:hypothetical protein SDRG_10020 [Saprolegnia diclina VS20]|uniref:AAA+ ATPase domain-containing protein n=1 Tax=Saprolegnia diclina (strain VS20) TaxID=1156394 RepID=T0RQD4_SAPDV|nr:hypothetical protein SDRG_10020 [Saprolegnia diclina VS20]EQC32272.1 hypothetical protein SDRG_10020 [Saprolegnia diclina VS20]|eukprot:XP_008614213.1 hypothetical protein SDRG_10020 [Saprolegnia diclina VS20]
MPGTPTPSPREPEKRPPSTLALPARKRIRHDSFDLERQPCALRLVLSPDCALSAEQVYEMYSLGLGIIDVSRDYNNFAALLRADFRSIFTDNATYHRLSRFMCTFSADLAADGSMSLRIANFSNNPVTLNGKRLRRRSDDLVQLHERDMIVFLADKDKKPLVAYRVEDRSEDDSSIGILFASPLVELDATGTPSPLSELDFRTEYHSVRDVLKKALDKFQKSLTEDSEGAAQVHAVHKPIHVYTRLATKQSFREWSASVTILHFTGHGNDQWLYMEGAMPGPAVPVSPAEIMELLPDKMALRLVFLSSCASANIAAAFLARGVKHVIATQPASELEDKAAIAFTRHFYGSIASGRTVQEAFDVGQRAVAVLHSTANPSEVARKFILLPADGDHEVPIFPPKEKRQPHSLSSSSLSLEDDMRCASQWMEAPTQDDSVLTPTTSLMYPTMLETTCTNFGFRNLDMYNVFVLLETNRVVTLTGAHGIGKTEMAIAIARYMDVRQRGWHRVRMASIGELQKEVQSAPNQDDEAYAARVAHVLLQKLNAADEISDWPAFVVVDDCDLLSAPDALRKRFEMAIEYLLQSHRSLRIVLTAQTSFEMPHVDAARYPRTTYDVPPLSPLDAANLFAKLNSQPMDSNQYARLQLAEPETSLTPAELAQLLSTSPRLQATNGNPLMILRLFEEVCTGSAEI